jgi:predicted RNA binding protein YcfA (HicA-like mRNA interferase family)
MASSASGSDPIRRHYSESNGSQSLSSPTRASAFRGKWAGEGKMPRKIRQLKADLRREGFSLDPERGKGSHTVWTHPDFPGIVTVVGRDGDDAQHYQEKEVRNAISAVRQRKPLS